MKRSVLAAVAALALLCSLWTPKASGQAVYGSILGTITDPSGAAVPNAKVTVTDQRKGTSDTTTTNDSGNYSVTHLIPDIYTVRVEGSGFKSLEFKDVIVNADAGSDVNGQFQVGSASEQVEVTAEAPQLKTDRADVAIEFNEKYVEDLPILNRNFTSFELLSPGTQKLGWGHAATENPQGSQQIFVQGQHFSGTAYELDGTDNQDPILGIIVVNPNLDAVTETKVALQNYDAEFGKAVAGVVTAQTKSGSNDIHGSAFWFRRTDATQAKDPFTQWDAIPSEGVKASPVPPSRWQQFGGSVGGPIIKNKLFFFGDYQATRQSNGVTNLLAIPTSLVQTTCNPATNTTGFCDLSEYVGTGGAGLIYDPNTGTPGVGTGSTATQPRMQFCGPAGCATEPNWIPMTAAAAVSVGHPAASVVSPQAEAILALFPKPQGPGITGNFLGSGAGPFSQNSFDTRIDYSASSSLNVFGRFSLDYFKLSGKGVLGALEGPGSGLLGLSGSSITHNYSLATGFTKTLSTSLLTDFRFGWFKYNPQTQKPDGGTPMTGFGIPNANTSDPKTAGLGSFILGSDPATGEGGAPNNGGTEAISSFGDGLGVGRCNCPLTEREDQFQFVNNWTKTKGNHILKFGADLRYARNLRIPSDNNRTGEYNFSPQETSNQNPPANTATGGLDLASFLLGDVSSMARYVTNPILTNINNAAERQKRLFFYGQDTYRATAKLTVSYGLRWEIYTPESVLAKGYGGFANIVDNGGTGVIRVAGYGGYGLNGNVQNTLNAFAPRLGVAYQLTPKTVVRMGYGRSYDMGVFGSNFGHTVTQNLPVLIKQNVDASALTAGVATGNDIPAFTLANGPVAPLFPAIPANGQITFASLGGQDGGVHIRPIKQVLPTLDAWNLTVQRQVTNTISAEVAYVGNKGSHGFSGDGPNYDINPLSMFLYGTGANSSLRRPLCDPVFTVPPGTGVTPVGSCSRLPDDLGNYYGNDASTEYDAFEAKVDKRFARGLQFIAHYTFAHANAYDSNYYAVSHPIAYGPNDFVRNHVFVFNPVYELPFGKGKQFLGNSSRAVDYLVGGWQLSDTTNWSSGLPWTPSTTECGSEEDVGICRPNKGPGSFHTGAGSFNGATHQIVFFTPLADSTGASLLAAGPTNGFALPSVGTIGNIGHNSFRGPSGFYSDLSVVKNIPIGERVKAQFRMDAFNIFNHPVYAFSGNNGANPCVDCGNAQANSSNGKITDLEAGTTMRALQFALRFNF
ncbi:MAG: carboxypeptidase-like regulatory domain-containing protein [Candidatus Sulfotelmatobacter sp.]